MSNVFFIMLICRKFLIIHGKKHLTHEICQKRFGRAKGALTVSAVDMLNIVY